LTLVPLKQKKVSSYEVALNDLLLAAPKVTAYYVRSPFGDNIDPHSTRAGNYIIDKSSAMLGSGLVLAS